MSDEKKLRKEMKSLKIGSPEWRELLRLRSALADVEKKERENAKTMRNGLSKDLVFTGVVGTVQIATLAFAQDFSAIPKNLIPLISTLKMRK